jgi:hypothetical protein
MFQNIGQTRIRNLLIIGLSVLVGSVACTTAPSEADALPDELDTSEAVTTTVVRSSKPAAATINDDSYPVVRQVALNNSTVQVVTGELSDAEIEDLLFMREEEKLARDVYLTLYDQWGLPLFQNIASSEQTHTDAIKTLIDRYGLEDPVMSDDIGVFTNPDLQILYNDLIDLGGQSLVDALGVGAVIEEIDILDLLEALDHTDKADIVRVYENLLSGSENHLRAFVRTLVRQNGEIYQPQYLSQDMFDTIINSAPANGGGYGGGVGSGNGGGGQGNGGSGNGKGQNS